MEVESISTHTEKNATNFPWLFNRSWLSQQHGPYHEVNEFREVHGFFRHLSTNLLLPLYAFKQYTDMILADLSQPWVKNENEKQRQQTTNG